LPTTKKQAVKIVDEIANGVQVTVDYAIEWINKYNLARAKRKQVVTNLFLIFLSSLSTWLVSLFS
jgi:hypothetical protein